jgi:hypothetical protein
VGEAELVSSAEATIVKTPDIRSKRIMGHTEGMKPMERVKRREFLGIEAVG